MENFQKLSRAEMRNVSGGVMANCSAKCFSGDTLPCSGKSCSATDAAGITDGSCTVAGEPTQTCKPKKVD
jgi:hypothetical protein